MMEQADIPPAASVAIISTRAVLSDEVRASLRAVREAQEVARVRARRQTRQTRLWVGAVAGIAVVGALVVRPHVARRPAVAAQAHPLVTVAPPAPPAAPAMVQSQVAASAPAATADSQPGCDATRIQKTPWLISPGACQRAFAADPSNAPLALAIAQAEHARGNLADGATWARRALALDPKAAEAYVLIARADAAEGRRDDARTAYSHYLELAPRGWHRAEARRGLHRDGGPDQKLARSSAEE